LTQSLWFFEGGASCFWGYTGEFTWRGWRGYSGAWGFVWQRQISQSATQASFKSLRFPAFSGRKVWQTTVYSPNTENIRESGVAEQVVSRCQTFAATRDDSTARVV